MKQKSTLWFVLFLLFAINLKAELKLPSIFSDNMLLQQDVDVKIWGWGSKGDSLTIEPSWTSKKYFVVVNNNSKWELKINTPKASYESYRIIISSPTDKIVLNNILIGEVWLCTGQSNMEMPMKGFKNQPVEGSNLDILKAQNKNLRLLTVKRTSKLKPQDDFIGSWSEASPEIVKDFSAVAYYFGELVQEILDVPVGLIVSSWGGSWIESWMSKEMLSGFNEVKIPLKETDIKVPNRTATTLYNGMINPLVGYSIKGCLMYQGESNYDRAKTYSSLLQTMVKEWRELWGQGDFPFFYCQIAPYNNPPEAHGNFSGAYLREAQLQALDLIPNSGMAVLMDLGEENCIHPKNKKLVGERLALLALGQAYERKGFAYKSPTLKSYEIEDSKMVLSFNDAPMWLTSYNKELSEFEIAGQDKVYYPAKANIKRSKVEVWSEKVPHPVAVRYAFKDFVVGDLFSTEGLPVSGFRTDDWNE
ncbi:MAG: sialate O-acetylesterase [Bacteroidales bacterium]|nr:sialate O-acetylesterase [Bacteroidales bacterium]